jgi:hypothetical protein
MGNMSKSDYSDDLTEARQSAQALVAGLTAEQLTRRPEPSGW